MSSRHPKIILRRKPTAAVPGKGTCNKDLSGTRPIPGIRRKGRDTPQATDFSVSSTLPENVPITEVELRALEVLLGTDLKELLAETVFESLRFSRQNR